MIVLFLISVFVILFTIWLLQYYQYEKHLKRIKGPRPLPFVGSAWEFGSVEELLPTLLRFQEKYGCLYKIYFGFEPTIFISDTKVLEQVLSSTNILEKSDDYKFLSRWLGTGLLTSDGDKWKKHRKILTPAFHFQVLEQFIDVFDYYGNILVEKLAQEVENESVNIYPYITLCSLDIICATSMGTKVNAQEDSESEYVRCVKEMCRIVMQRSVSLIKMFETLYKFSRDYQKEKRALKVIHGYTYSVINSRKEEINKCVDEDNSSIEDDFGRKRKKTFLDLLLQYKKNGQSISDEDIRQEVDTFMFEGHDTTASAMSFTLYCLAKHPNVQEKVVQELQAIFLNNKDRSATYRELQEMKYLEQVIKEALRLYPSVSVYARRVNKNIEYDGGVLPKGSTLTIFAYGLHRRSDIYPNPEQFDPERFTQENQLNRSPYAYLPFSAGPRNCIGQKFAMLEMKSVIAKLLRNYEVTEVPNHKLIPVPETVLKSKTGMCIRLKKRSF